MRDQHLVIPCYHVLDLVELVRNIVFGVLQIGVVTRVPSHTFTMFVAIIDPRSRGIWWHGEPTVRLALRERGPASSTDEVEWPIEVDLSQVHVSSRSQTVELQFAALSRFSLRPVCIARRFEAHRADRRRETDDRSHAAGSTKLYENPHVRARASCQRSREVSGRSKSPLSGPRCAGPLPILAFDVRYVLMRQKARSRVVALRRCASRKSAHRRPRSTPPTTA